MRLSICRRCRVAWRPSSRPGCCIRDGCFLARDPLMLWAALSLPSAPDGTPPSSDALRGLAIWALQFTPRVALADEAVVLEVAASTRLFGGRRALHERLDAQGRARKSTRLNSSHVQISY